MNISTPAKDLSDIASAPDRESGPTANEIGPAGETANSSTGRPVSGQPSGGPDDLGKQASEPEDASNPPDALGAGINAYGSGRARSDCPYPADSSERTQWLEGWDRPRNSEGVE